MTLNELYTGSKGKVNFDRDVICRKCSGLGGKPGAVQTCRECRGQGMVMKVVQSGPGKWQTNKERTIWTIKPVNTTNILSLSQEPEPNKSDIRARQTSVDLLSATKIPFDSSKSQNIIS